MLLHLQLPGLLHSCRTMTAATRASRANSTISVPQRRQILASMQRRTTTTVRKGTAGQHVQLLAGKHMHAGAPNSPSGAAHVVHSHTATRLRVIMHPALQAPHARHDDDQSTRNIHMCLNARAT